MTADDNTAPISVAPTRSQGNAARGLRSWVSRLPGGGFAVWSQRSNVIAGDLEMPRDIAPTYVEVIDACRRAAAEVAKWPRWKQEPYV